MRFNACRFPSTKIFASRKSRPDQNGNPQTYETQIDVMQKCSHLGAVATTSKRLKNNGQLGGTHRQARKQENPQVTWATTLDVSLPQQ